MKLLMIVTVLGASGLTNAYKSVLSACGSAAINGASRWLEAPPGVGPRPTNTPTAAAAATAVTATRRLVVLNGATAPSSSFWLLFWRVLTDDGSCGCPRVRWNGPPFRGDCRVGHPRFPGPPEVGPPAPAHR